MNDATLPILTATARVRDLCFRYDLYRGVISFDDAELCCYSVSVIELKGGECRSTCLLQDVSREFPEAQALICKMSREKVSPIHAAELFHLLIQ